MLDRVGIKSHGYVCDKAMHINSRGTNPFTLSREGSRWAHEKC